MALSAALLSSAVEHWLTPPGFLRLVVKVHGHIDMDPATNRGTVVPANDHAYVGEVDGLSIPWRGNVYNNPPFGTQIGLWVRRMIEHGEHTRAAKIIAMLPARVDTAWGQSVMGSADAWCFWAGRITFWRVWDPAAELERLTNRERGLAIAGVLETLRDGALPKPFVLNANGLVVGPELNKSTGLPQPAPFPSLVPYWGDDVAAFARVFRRKGSVTIRRGDLRGVYPRIAA